MSESIFFLLNNHHVIAIHHLAVKLRYTYQVKVLLDILDAWVFCHYSQSLVIFFNESDEMAP